MIVRILGEGQFTLGEDRLAGLNELDGQLETAVDSGDETRFRTALASLLDAVRSGGERLPDESLEDSDLILPHAEATLEEVREMLEDDGLIPG